VTVDYLYEIEFIYEIVTQFSSSLLTPNRKLKS